MQLQDRRIVVTGGIGALGEAVVLACIGAGAHCHLPYRHQAEADRSPHRGHPQVSLAAVGDLADEAAVTQFFASVPHLWASIHLAGGFLAQPVGETTMAQVSAMMRTNFETAWLCSRAAIEAMGAQGGRIVNVAARPALEWRLGEGMAAYAASKAAVAAMTVALAQEVAARGILVNAVAPSIMDTPANRAAMPEADYANWPKVDEVAQTILFLTSPENRVTRGAIVPVYGRA